VKEIQPVEGVLCNPYYVDALADGHHLICDTGNERVVELDALGRVAWQYGNSIAKGRFLSYPRSVAFHGAGEYLVADTAHDRILQIDKEQIKELPFQGKPGLFWPRCVRKLPTGSLLIADARNRRIVEVTREGRILKELRKIDALDRQTLRDPHDVRLLNNGHLLVADSPRDVVLELDWSGHVHRSLGERADVNLKDPHSAQQLEDGSYVVADTGNHRIVWFDAHGNYARQIDTVERDASLLRLCQPRYAELSPDGTLLIVDTGNNRVLATTLSGQLIWEFFHVPTSRIGWLNQPRWAQLVSRYEVVISDHFHHRILHVRYEGDEANS
jgi:DNA-binding beta-propeller fold protein YncE